MQEEIIPDTTSSKRRTAIYIDGGHFRKGSVFRRYHHSSRKWIDARALREFCNAYYARVSGCSPSMVQSVKASYFDGSYPAPVPSAAALHQRKEDQALTAMGYQVKRFPMKRAYRSISDRYHQQQVAAARAASPVPELCHAGAEGRSAQVLAGDEMPYTFKQKQVDTALTAAMIDAAHRNEFDVAILVAGDNDLVPALQLLCELGKQVLVVYFSFRPWVDSAGYHSATEPDAALLKAATWTLNITDVVFPEPFVTAIPFKRAA